jgi:membrane-bound lytic murein transglycosylase B
VRRTTLVSGALAFALAACGHGEPLRIPSRAPTAPTPAFPRTIVPSATPSVFLPDPDRPVPDDPQDVAGALAQTTEALHASVDAWRAGGLREDAPQAVVLQALYQQRLYRALSKDPSLWRRTRRLLQGGLRREAEANVRAMVDLRAIVSPVGRPVTFRVGPPTPAHVLLGFYHSAERRFGVPWNVLAAVNFVESKFGRTRSASSAGAQGPMQFIPSTWAAYGMGGDIHDPRDAVMGAANYLHANGAPDDLRRALFAYNRSSAYVDAVLAYAGRIGDDARAFAEYYDWQVFIATPSGDERLTGPGL